VFYSNEKLATGEEKRDLTISLVDIETDCIPVFLFICSHARLLYQYKGKHHFRLDCQCILRVLHPSGFVDASSCSCSGPTTLFDELQFW